LYYNNKNENKISKIKKTKNKKQKNKKKKKKKNGEIIESYPKMNLEKDENKNLHNNRVND